MLRVTWYAVPSLAAALLSAVVCAYAWRFRSRPVTLPFVTMMGAVGAWSLVDAAQVSTVAVRVDAVLAQLGITFGTVVPPLWLVVTLRYAEVESWLSPTLRRVLAGEALLVSALTWTNPAHGLVWTGSVYRGEAALFDLVYGPALWLHTGYAYLLVVAGVAALLWVYRAGTRVDRRQSGLLVVGAVVPLGANAVATAGLSPVPGLDLTTPAFTLTGVVFALALYRYDFLALPPAAYRDIHGAFGDGVLLFDPDRTLLEANDRAGGILECRLAAGSRAEDLFDYPLADVDGTLHESGDGRVYEARHAPLHDREGDVVGHAVVMREVTDRHQYEQRLEVTNRVLRHNLRNEVNAILGYADLLADRHGEDEGVGRIRDAARRLETVSEGARHIQSLVGTDHGGPDTVDLASVVDRVADRYRDRYPDATVTCETPAAAPVRGDEESLALAVENVVENAIEHNDRAEPTVDLSVRADGEWTSLRVADDGPGIPEGERRPIETDRETPLDHTSSLGLWLVKWAVDGAGGRVAFEDGDPRGTVVTLRLQSATRRQNTRTPERTRDA